MVTKKEMIDNLLEEVKMKPSTLLKLKLVIDDSGYYYELDPARDVSPYECMLLFFVCVPQSLVIVVVGFTFLDQEVPTDFVPHWDDYLGETSEPVEDWCTGPFYQHLPPQKGTF